MTDTASAAGRDPRIDVLRGAALFMIFVDHIPNNVLVHATLHNVALCDATELFVVLAGMSSAFAYGPLASREGWGPAARRIARRCGQIYLAQVGLVMVSLLIVRLWTGWFHLPSTVLAPMLEHPVQGILYGLLLAAQPDYLNILPMYIAMLALFPAVWALARRSGWLALGASGLVWAAAGWLPGLNLPNWVTHDGWYFDPFSWQLMFTVGVVAARAMAAHGGGLPRHPALLLAAVGFLLLTLPQAAAWHDLGLPALPVALPADDKSHLAWPRVASAVALIYLVFSSPAARAVAGRPAFRFLDRCGRHSLEVFVAGCLAALLARGTFRTTDATLVLQFAVIAGGVAGMLGAARWAGRQRSPPAFTRVGTLVSHASGYRC